MTDLLDRIDAYLDAVPRSRARAEAVGPFTLFVKNGPGWPYYARCARGHGSGVEIGVGDVQAVLARQTELGVPQTFEWVHDLVPDLAQVAREAGLSVTQHPLLVLDRLVEIPTPPHVEVRMATGNELRDAHAVAEIAFTHGGTAAGPAGPREAAAVQQGDAQADYARGRLRDGLTFTALALVDGTAVASGSHQPVGDATEIVGVATLPMARRRGVGAAVTRLLVEDALARGIELVFLSAGDEAIARVYERVGFRPVGTACAAEPRE